MIYPQNLCPPRNRIFRDDDKAERRQRRIENLASSMKVSAPTKVCCWLFGILMPDFCQGCSKARDEHGDWHSQVGLHGSGWLVMIRVFMMWTNFANSFPSERSEEEGEREESRPRVRIFLNSVFREYFLILFPENISENISQFCFSRIF